MRLVTALSVLSSITLGSACSGDDAAPEARLLALADCGAAADYVKQVAIARMNEQIDREIRAYAKGDYCYGGSRTQGGAEDSASPGSGGGAGGGGGEPPPAPTTGTGTNNQVAGVDEADFVKNDGQYIYLAQNGVFRIVDSWPASETHEVSATPIEGTPKKLFVEGDTALLYVAIGAGSSYSRDCSYGYDCDFIGDGTQTKLLVFDIADRSAPVLEREVGLTGSLITGRRIGNAVHTVVTQATSLFPNLRYYTQVPSCDGDYPSPSDYYIAKDAFEALRAANRASIEATDLENRLPVVTDSAALTPSGGQSSCTSLYAGAFQDGTAFTSIVSLDLDNPGPVKMSTIVSRSGAIYASADALYMAVGHLWSDSDLSTIHKFRISEVAADTHYVASGKVSGRALNQFAMDERDGRLRIATTNGRAPSDSAVSYVSVLEEQGNELVTVGSLGGIAPTEDIRSVRFDGDRAFVVTFKKTDPLFAFDLSDPTRPTKLGELKIPGFSTYMHMLDSHHLLTIGYDADDHGDFAYFDGVLLQIFDVTDPSEPALAHKHIIGTRGSSSEALTNHLAFTWYPERSLLSLPMTICEGGDDGLYGSQMTFSGLMVFDATVAGGFAEHGRVPHSLQSGASCYNWWTSATSAVKRSLFLDHFVYSISDAELKVRSVDALASELVTLPLE
ncbi:MAG: beta-propeller domain-containing protein [Kofleriaceae bacterium]